MEGLTVHLFIRPQAGFGGHARSRHDQKDVRVLDSVRSPSELLSDPLGHCVWA